MSIFEGGNWFRARDKAPRLDDPEPFWRRHFWPPSVWGATALALVLSVIVGLTGALIYVSSEPTSAPADPTEEPPEASGDLAPGLQETTTTKAEILSTEALTKKVAPSVWTVDTLDEEGRPSVGSAFAAGSAPGQTFLLTSLAVVQSSTRQPSPDINVRNGNTQVKATLWSWQEEFDLAMLVIARSVPSISWVDTDGIPKPGDKLFVAAGTGGLSAGALATLSPTIVQHNIFTDEMRRGGPLLTEKGQVVGMASQAYNPGGAGTERIFFGVPVGISCQKVLACGAGNLDADSATASSIAPPPGGTTTTAAGGRTTTTAAGGRTTTTVRRTTTTSP